MTMEDWEMAERNALKASKDRFAVNNREVPPMNLKKKPWKVLSNVALSLRNRGAFIS